VSDPPKLVVATRNLGKTREFARLLGDRFRVEMVPEDVELPRETRRTFEDNARVKAEAVFAALDGRVAVLADDSGLEVAALDGRPGVLSARYAGERASDADNVAKLLRELRGRKDREARFVCALCLALKSEWPGGRLPGHLVEVRGIVEGTITEAPRGSAGFGYDPVFQPRGAGETLAEASPTSKDLASHRGAAVRALLFRLGEEGWANLGS